MLRNDAFLIHFNYDLLHSFVFINIVKHFNIFYTRANLETKLKSQCHLLKKNVLSVDTSSHIICSLDCFHQTQLQIIRWADP